MFRKMGRMPSAHEPGFQAPCDEALRTRQRPPPLSERKVLAHGIERGSRELARREFIGWREVGSQVTREGLSGKGGEGDGGALNKGGRLLVCLILFHCVSYMQLTNVSILFPCYKIRFVLERRRKKVLRISLCIQTLLLFIQIIILHPRTFRKKFSFLQPTFEIREHLV